MEVGGAEECKTDETPYFLTTQTPERQSTKSIIATRPKPEASATRLHVGERVVVALHHSQSCRKEVQIEKYSTEFVFCCVR